MPKFVVRIPNRKPQVYTDYHTALNLVRAYLGSTLTFEDGESWTHALVLKTLPESRAKYVFSYHVMDKVLNEVIEGETLLESEYDTPHPNQSWEPTEKLARWMQIHTGEAVELTCVVQKWILPTEQDEYAGLHHPRVYGLVPEHTLRSWVWSGSEWKKDYDIEGAIR